MPLSKEEWEVHVLSYDIKSCNKRGYCREKGISYQAFRYWYKKLVDNLDVRPDKARVAKSSFLPVRLKSQNVKTTGQGRLRLKVKDITIVVGDDDFSPELLRQTLSVIRSC